VERNLKKMVFPIVLISRLNSVEKYAQVYLFVLVNRPNNGSKSQLVMIATRGGFQFKN